MDSDEGVVIVASLRWEQQGQVISAVIAQLRVK
jgi:hypothetical protein